MPTRIDLDTLTTALDTSPDVRETVLHNLAIFKRIHGGLHMARENAMDFRPREDYWWMPERRLLVAYFAKRWQRSFAPADALRSLALRWFRHYQRGRDDGLFATDGHAWSNTVRYATFGGYAHVASRLIEHARSFRDEGEFQRLLEIWPRRAAPSAAEHLIAYLKETVQDDDFDADLEPAYSQRLPWFAFLGAADRETLVRQQRYHYGYANLMTSTNAYRTAGAQTVAGLLQNTPNADILAQVETWLGEAPPDGPWLEAISIDDDEPADRSHYMPFVELAGFVRLHRQPFLNRQTLDLLRARYEDVPDDAYEVAARVAADLREELRAQPETSMRLAARFRAMSAEVFRPLTMEMEGLSSRRAARQAGEDETARIDAQLHEELDEAAMRHVQALSDEDCARCMAHLLLDATIYVKNLEDARAPKGGSTPQSGGDGDPPSNGPGASTNGRTVVTPVRRDPLPAGLRDPGERALSFLRAGLHVLLAGAPGTGKTTLAQFVGGAWNRDTDTLPERLADEDLPVTTVANSGWSPFHTIGGLQPKPDGTFRARKGVFIDPADGSEERAWQLRGGAIVLDEMNRADLDRCVGELYPLLSQSVSMVHPAGIPGIDRIYAHDRFRIIATVNDATLDDVVFPISEGLARRFQRIEMPGASEQDLLDYLGVSAPGDELQEHVQELVSTLFSEASELGILSQALEQDRLRIGVGYFALLRRWIHGQLQLPRSLAELDERQAALELLRASMATLRRDDDMQALLGRVAKSY